jgi:hypothetical protein
LLTFTLNKKRGCVFTAKKGGSSSKNFGFPVLEASKSEVKKTTIESGNLKPKISYLTQTKTQRSIHPVLN